LEHDAHELDLKIAENNATDKFVRNMICSERGRRVLGLRRSNLEWIVLFKMIAKGEMDNLDAFYKMVQKVAIIHNIEIKEFEGTFMMPSTNLYHEDQTEHVLEEMKKRW